MQIHTLQITKADQTSDRKLRKKILGFLEKNKLFNSKFLYRGFPLKRLEYCKKIGLDHPLGAITFGSTLEELRTSSIDDNAIGFAIDGACLAVLSRHALTPTEDPSGYNVIRSCFPKALIAIILLTGDGVGYFKNGVLEEAQEEEGVNFNREFQQLYILI